MRTLIVVCPVSFHLLLDSFVCLQNWPNENNTLQVTSGRTLTVRLWPQNEPPSTCSKSLRYPLYLWCTKGLCVPLEQLGENHGRESNGRGRGRWGGVSEHYDRRENQNQSSFVGFKPMKEVVGVSGPLRGIVSVPMVQDGEVIGSRRGTSLMYLTSHVVDTVDSGPHKPGCSYLDRGRRNSPPPP